MYSAFLYGLLSLVLDRLVQIGTKKGTRTKNQERYRKPRTKNGTGKQEP